MPASSESGSLLDGRSCPRVTVVLDEHDDPISGHVSSENDDADPFDDWTGLLAALEQALRARVP